MYSKEATRIENQYRRFSNPVWLIHEGQCWECGDVFKSASPRARYCSQRCTNDAAIKRRKAKIEQKRGAHEHCTVCGKAIIQNGYKVQIYCSAACKQRGYRQKHGCGRSARP